MKQSAGIIVKVNNRCLVCKRAADVNEPAKWAIPMGGIDEGEDPKDTAYREFYEEMGVSIDGVIKPLVRINRFNKLGNIKSILHVFLFKTDTEIIPDLDGAADGFEHTECEYITLQQIKELNMSSGIKEVLTDLLNF
ncbi:MutT NTP pyrophosphohydrolases including oxidative damage repair enzymes [uncultured Caudovirales phage]|uniref:8-oxo-dGTP diphosphatase n=1 Tax=uncultured Caudovirales phage TaxID=2100421 RepID=A0A6J5L506_9CAUD|nr:MutT NTP pyrophosphohydrolases including oxidative damage repair enzymes [uncultured Caudovirales phage]